MKLLILFVSMLSWIFLPAQSVQWTWISGDSTGNHIDVYGNRRILDSVNKPGSISPHETWIDKSGNFYMFGGHTLAIRFGFDTIPVFSNALWKYSPVKNIWAMITGANLLLPAMSGGGGVFGTPGVPAPDNTPPAWEYTGITWTDVAGNWWMFGGKTGYRAFGTNSQLWKFDPIIGQWTFLRSNGDDISPTYGTKGIPALPNTPGARTGMISWTDREGYLYLYGGYLEINRSVYGDVWKYDPKTNLWTWLSGRQWYFEIIDKPVYGTKGVFAPDNTPGAFSGHYTLGEADSSGIISMSILGELWSYSIKNNQWAWINGDRAINANPNPKRNYGIKGVPSAANHPGIRYGAANWTDTAGNRWLFGGYLNNFSDTYLNDLWKYTVQTSEWTWMDGDSTLNRDPNFGIKGKPSATNQPGARNGSVTWRDAEGNLWLFGGFRQSKRSSSSTSTPYTNTLNDLWKLTVGSGIVPIKLSEFSAWQKNEQVVLQWNTPQERNTKEFIIQRSPDSIQFTTIGTVAAAGDASTVSRYQFLDNAPLSGNNFYRLKQVNLNNAFEYSAVAKVLIDITGFTYRIFQNPVLHELRIALKTDQAATLQVRISNAAGHLLIVKNISITQGMSTHAIPIRQLSTGIYFISIINDKKTITKRFYKSGNVR